MTELIRDLTGNWHLHTKDCTYCYPKYKIIITNTTNDTNR